MRKRKLLLHFLFWTAYLLPTVYEIIAQDEINLTQKSLILWILNLSIALAVFYILTEWLVPRCMRLKGWRNIFWLSLPLFWIGISYFHIEIEKWAYQYLGLTQQRPAVLLDYLAGTFWFMVIATGITLSHMWYENQLKIRDIENLAVRVELEHLRYRVNPHFLFNTLNSLYALTLDKSDKAPKIVLQLSQLMRYMLQDESREVPLKSEIEHLENYLELERIRLDNHVQVTMHVEGEMDNQKIAPMILLPFIENSFKHGVNDSLQEGYVEVEIRISKKELFFYVENSKRTKLLSTSGRKTSPGIGLANVRRRLELLYGPEHYTLEIEDLQDNYCVSLYLKLS